MRAIFATAMLVFAGTSLSAQTVVGTVTDRSTRAPIAGAFVVLLDDDVRLTAVLTDEAGSFALRAPAPGRYRIRIERIGYASTMTDPFVLAAGESVRRAIAVSSRAISLEGITAEAERRCTLRPAEGLATARVWEEARKALSAASWTEDAGVYRYRVVRYERRLTRAGRIEREHRTSRSGFYREPFSSVAASELVEHGFVWERDDGGATTYHAPDADVLLSDAFLDTHCLRITADDAPAPGLLGLAFEPVRGERRPDVRGVLWLDAETAELRSLEYRYVNVDVPSDADRLGGRIVFERVPNGPWIVRRWMLRMPRIGVQYDGFSGAKGRRVVIGFEEEGGEVEAVFGAAGEAVLASRTSASLAGVVWDSTRARPLAGAFVYLSGTSYADTADVMGRFRIDDLPDGDYGAAVRHPRLDALGVFTAPSTVELRRGERTEVRLATPSPSTILSRLCGNSVSDGYAGLLAGVAVDARTGDPVPGAVVAVGWSSWDLRNLRRSGDDSRGAAGAARTERGVTSIEEDWVQIQAIADEGGTYRICGMPPEVDFRARAYPPGTRLDADGGVLTVTLAPSAGRTPFEQHRIPPNGLAFVRLVVSSPEATAPRDTSARMLGTVLDDGSDALTDGVRVDRERSAVRQRFHRRSRWLWRSVGRSQSRKRCFARR